MELPVQRILETLPRLRIGVIGDLFLDRYLDLDARLTEPSLETGLDAYQVVRIRSSPGAAGTIINNLAALDVGVIRVMSIIGQDGEGFELKRELERRRVDPRFLFETPDRFTPTYTKPMLEEPGRPPRELTRLDIKNRSPLPPAWERRLVECLPLLLDEVDALLVLDQVSEVECGVITTAVRQRLAELGEAHPARIILADSRKRIGDFRNVWLKPNQFECQEAVPEGGELEDCCRRLASRAGRPVFCTRGELGILATDPRPPGLSQLVSPAFPVVGPIDPVGAGDSTSAGLACALAAGADLAAAAAFGNLIASITIQQLGTTGTASPRQVMERWRQVRSGAADSTGETCS